jgi:hypothetical protein
MSRNREGALSAVSQIPRFKLPALTICISLLPLFSAVAQNISSSANTPTANKICEGKLPVQTASHQDQSPTSDGKDHLKLSAKEDRESSQPQGQYCTREKSDRDSLRPSVSSDQPDAARETEQPATAPPIAQVIDGKMIIRANGQDFATVLEAVRSATGFAIEMPPSITSEPVFLNVGPTSVTNALVALLDGTSYNYFILGSEQDSSVVKRLVLTERANAGSGTLVASTQGPAAASQPMLYGGVQPDAEAENSEPPPPPPAPIQPSVIPSSIPVGVNIQKLAAESGKTTGQILDELQKRQQQVLDEQAASQSQSAPQQ